MSNSTRSCRHPDIDIGKKNSITLYAWKTIYQWKLLSIVKWKMPKHQLHKHASLIHNAYNMYFRLSTKCLDISHFMPSVLWHCWLGIQPAKTDWWGVGVCSEVQIICIWSSWCHCHPKTPSSLASFKSILILPFWYRLTQVVLEKRPLNECGINV